MKPIEVEMPDGSIAEFPAGTPDAEIERVLSKEAPRKSFREMASSAVDTAKNIGGFALDSGKQAAGGFYKAAAGAMSQVPGMNLAMSAGGGSPQAMEKLFGAPEGETKEGELWRKTMEGGGQALLSPMEKVKPAVQALGGLTSGLASELGGRFGESAGRFGKLGGEILGGVLGGGLTGWALGPRQSVAKADIRRELAGTPESRWQQASRNIDDFNQSGSTTATLAEAFPGQTRLGALANQAANAKGGEALGQQLSQREGDLSLLGETFLNRIGPAVDANQVANAAADSAGGVYTGTKQLRGNAIGNTLRNETVPDVEVFKIYNDLMTRATAEKRPDAASAYREVARTLLDQNGQLLTGLQDLSLAMKALKKRPGNPNAPVTPGQVISDVDLKKAISFADERLKVAAPPYKLAMDEFESFSQGALEPMRVGPIGSLMDKNPLTAGQTSVSRMEGLLTGNSPATIKSQAGLMADSNFTAGAPPTNPLRIARALAQQKLDKGSTNPGATIRGLPGSGAEGKFNALLEAGGGNVSHINQPLRAADELQKLAPATGISGFPEMRSSQLAIRPFRTIDMMLTGQFEKSIKAEVADLLKSPTQENLARLREIAMFDPNTRRILTAYLALQPVTRQEN